MKFIAFCLTALCIFTAIAEDEDQFINFLGKAYKCGPNFKLNNHGQVYSCYFDVPTKVVFRNGETILMEKLSFEEDLTKLSDDNVISKLETKKLKVVGSKRRLYFIPEYLIQLNFDAEVVEGYIDHRKNYLYIDTQFFKKLPVSGSFTFSNGKAFAEYHSWDAEDLGIKYPLLIDPNHIVVHSEDYTEIQCHKTADLYCKEIGMQWSGCGSTEVSPKNPLLVINTRTMELQNLPAGVFNHIIKVEDFGCGMQNINVNL